MTPSRPDGPVDALGGSTATHPLPQVAARVGRAVAYALAPRALTNRVAQPTSAGGPEWVRLPSPAMPGPFGPRYRRLQFVSSAAVASQWTKRLTKVVPCGRGGVRVTKGGNGGLAGTAAWLRPPEAAPKKPYLERRGALGQRRPAEG